MPGRTICRRMQALWWRARAMIPGEKSHAGLALRIACRTCPRGPTRLIHVACGQRCGRAIEQPSAARVASRLATVWRKQRQCGRRGSGLAWRVPVCLPEWRKFDRDGVIRGSKSVPETPRGPSPRRHAIRKRHLSTMLVDKLVEGPLNNGLQPAWRLGWRRFGENRATARNANRPLRGGRERAWREMRGRQALASSSLYASTGMQAQNTFLSPCTLSTRPTGGQYFCSRRLASGNAASSRG